MNSRLVSCEKARIFSRPGGGRHTGAAGSNGGKVLGMVMPDGPLCAADGADTAIRPSAKTARPSQMTCRRIAVLPGNIFAPPRPGSFPAGRILLSGLLDQAAIVS